MYTKGMKIPEKETNQEKKKLANKQIYNTKHINKFTKQIDKNTHTTNKGG